MFDIAVIGGGASGLAASIGAKRVDGNLKICIIEVLPRVGKKILATGNGRCNLTNLNATALDYNNPFVACAFESFPPKTVIRFFESMGLKCVADGEGRVYPMSNTAASVLDCLRFEAERLNIEIICDTKADKIEKKGDLFVINNSIKAKKVILATGGKASPSQGSDGSGYPLLKMLGHRVTPLYPALVQLTVSENVKALKGVRVKSKVKLCCKEKTVDSAGGEILFTDYGLSGIAIMDISRSVKNRKCQCVLDILPEMNKEEIRQFICDRKALNPQLSAENMLTGLVPKKAGQFVLKLCGVHGDAPVVSLNDFRINEIAEKMKKLTFTVSGTNGFKNAQLTCGGGELDEFNPCTMESKKVKGLYCTGELLDVDSVCGGFNLQWAWASGLLAGQSAANE